MLMVLLGDEAARKICERLPEGALRVPAQEIADAILSDVSRFQGDHDRFDDETIIVLRVR